MTKLQLTGMLIIRMIMFINILFAFSSTVIIHLKQNWIASFDTKWSLIWFYSDFSEINLLLIRLERRRPPLPPAWLRRCGRCRRKRDSRRHAGTASAPPRFPSAGGPRAGPRSLRARWVPELAAGTGGRSPQPAAAPALPPAPAAPCPLLLLPACSCCSLPAPAAPCPLPARLWGLCSALLGLAAVGGRGVWELFLSRCAPQYLLLPGTCEFVCARVLLHGAGSILGC